MGTLERASPGSLSVSGGQAAGNSQRGPEKRERKFVGLSARGGRSRIWKTLPVGLYNLSVSQQYAANWSALFGGVTILCVPTFLIFVLLQERIVAGLTVGAVKE